MRSPFHLIRSAFFFMPLISLSSNLKAQSDIHVDRNGSAAPDATAEKPYQLVKAGVCRGRQNGKIVIHPGIYNETLTIKEPMTLTAVGPATIGQISGKPHTDLKVVTYNTHLFGNEGAWSGRFADRTRDPPILRNGSGLRMPT